MDDRKRWMERERDWWWRLFWDRKQIPWVRASKGQFKDFTNTWYHLQNCVCVCECVCLLMCKFFSGMRWRLQDFTEGSMMMSGPQSTVQITVSQSIFCMRWDSKVLWGSWKGFLSNISQHSESLVWKLTSWLISLWDPCLPSAGSNTENECVFTHLHTLSLSPSEQF